MSDPGAVMIAVAVMTAAAVTVTSIAKAVVRYQENKLKYARESVSLAADARLERMEHAVDAIALEIERISEGQRFTTKLLAERTPSRSIS
jgi:hypothetical protein